MAIAATNIIFTLFTCTFVFLVSLYKVADTHAMKPYPEYPKKFVPHLCGGSERALRSIALFLMHLHRIGFNLEFKSLFIQSDKESKKVTVSKLHLCVLKNVKIS